MIDSMAGIHLRGVCSNYFENHVSPVLKYIQQSQERLDKRMDDVVQKLAVTNGSLDKKANRDEVPSASDLEALSKTQREGLSVQALSRLQELSTIVQKKADASEISRLSALVEQKATVSQRKSDVAAYVSIDNVSTIVDEKLETFREPMLKQIEDLSSRIEVLFNAVESKAELLSTPTLEQWQRLESDVQASSSSLKQIQNVAAQVETLAVALESKADSKELPTYEQWHRLEKDVQDISSSSKQIENFAARVEALAAALENKAESKDVPTLDQWKRLEKEVQTSSTTSGNLNGEKSELKKVQMLVAAAGARFDRQLKELRQQVREVKERSPSKHVDGSQLEDCRWPGRVIRTGTDDEVDSANGGRAPSQCESIPDSLAGSVTGLGPEERAELQKIQAVVGAAGTAFSREIRELRKLFTALNDEIKRLKEHVHNSNPKVAGA